MSSTLKGIEITEPGGPEVLQEVIRPRPQPQANEVLIEVTAAGVNRPDVIQRRGLYPAPEGASDLPGLEVAGKIIAVGPNVEADRVGQSVCALLPGGGYASHAIADDRLCLPIPKGLSMSDAAALPEVVITVWANMVEAGHLSKGESVLIHGGTSGIGMMAIQIAKAMNAKVFTTAGTAEKCQAARDVGADFAYNYKQDDWESAIHAEGGIDVVLDMIGGDYVTRNLNCLKRQGRHVSIAFLGGVIAHVNIMQMMRRRLTLTGSTLRARSIEEKARLVAAVKAHIWPLIESGKIKPIIDSVYPLAEAAKAHEKMEASQHIGKIILQLSAE
ncbi:MAG: NAD(P)H-quinone oxidoreductase [bacterium]